MGPTDRCRRQDGAPTRSAGAGLSAYGEQVSSALVFGVVQDLARYSRNIDNHDCHRYIDSCMVSVSQSVEQMPWTVDGFVDAAERIMVSSPELFASSDTGSGKELNVRLIRDYVVRDFIPRPGKLGREARFGLDHLVHLLAVRVLLRSQKWSLPAIKASLGSTDTEGLLNGVLAPIHTRIEKEFTRAAKSASRQTAGSSESSSPVPPLNPALQLIERFKAGQATSKNPAFSLRASGSASPPGLSSGAPPPQFGKAQSATSTMLHLRLEDWCEVVIDASRAKSLKPSEIEALAESLKRSLKDELPS